MSAFEFHDGISIMQHTPTALPDHLLRLQSNDGACIAVSLFGGQLCSWQTPDGVERLFVSSRVQWNNQQAIRGGVPIIFPQFADAGSGPRHGFARTLPWTLLDASVGADGEAVVRLELTDCAVSRKLSDDQFALTVEIRCAGSTLQVSLTVKNTGTAPLDFCAALHTYIRTNLPTASIHGLQHAPYRDATADGHISIDSEFALIIDKEIDRLYLHAPSDITLHSDAGIIAVSQTGFTETVVWNPWRDKTQSLPDCAAHDYLEFVCIEAALADRAHHLLPHQCWRGTQILCISDVLKSV